MGLITFGNCPISENNRKCVRFFVVDYFHGVLQYFLILFVLYAVTT